jgi:phospholipid/cholesterol/gamma-HCH transport system substrate-binding protein
MKREILETTTGMLVLIILVFLVYYSINLGNVNLLGDDHYQIYAEFSSVSGLNNGVPVDIAGVDVGKVEEITFEPKSEMARVRMEIKDGVKIQDDDVASIRTQGIIGDKFVSISSGESSKFIPPGGMIKNTKPPIDFEQLISQFVQGKV